MHSLKVALLKNSAVGLIVCMLMLSVDNVAGTEDDVVVVEFDEMRLMLSHADGDGEFLS